MLITMATNVDTQSAVHGLSHACLAAIWQKRTRGQETSYSVYVSTSPLCSCSVDCTGVRKPTSPGRLSTSIRQVHGRLQKPAGSPCTTCSRLSARQAMRGSIISSNAGASTSTPCKMLHKLCVSRCCSMLCLQSQLRDCAPRDGSGSAFC